MPVRTSSAQWNGDLKSGNGTMKIGKGAWEGPFSFSSRFENGNGTNPEELIAAAHAGCFSMAFSNALSQAGFKVDHVSTKANVHLEKTDAGFGITTIDLDTEGKIEGIDNSKFQEIAEDAKKNCPVSKVLAGATITLKAKLL
ncbi:MAG TPA: OsmC family protein [Balneolales bacterium]|nr:OsmC family protein [Balneolales bacterium]